MQNKDPKAIIAYCAPIIALAIGSAFGLTQEEQNMVTDVIIMTGSAILGIIGVVGVIKEHKKKDDK
ncbi:hypothetical protein [Weizmannia phage Youna2]